MDFRAKAEEIFMAGTNAVLPSVLIPQQVRIRDNNLIVCGRTFPLDLVDDIFVIGAGKATAPMAAEIEKVLGSLIREGHIVVKYDHISDLETISLTEAGHPVPDANGFRATKTILRIANVAGTDDLVICLLSGGGSALLTDYPEGSSPEDVAKLNSLLVNSGADISEINTVRKHISMVKGGQLARAAYPATLISLIISDVAGDALSVIASGPTVPDETTFKQALDILLKYNLVKSVPSSIIRYLEEGRDGIRTETPGPSDIAFRKTHNFIIGSNKIALEAARIKAVELGMNALVIDTGLQGDVEAVAEYIISEALQFQAEEHHEPVCLIFGGETTLKMTGDGAGGRNQHLALLASVLLKDHPGITFLSAGTDGSDGPTDAAGAVVDSDSVEIAASKGLDPADFVKRFDSYNFFRATGGHIITGPTMTNVMDLIVVVIA
jgi:glycerate 2-kinase